MHGLKWIKGIGPVVIAGTAVCGVANIADAHGYPSHIENCHRNLDGPGYHCHVAPEAPQSIRPRRPPSTTSSAPSHRRGCALQNQLMVRQRPQVRARVIHRLARNKCVFLNNRPFRISGNSVSWIQVTLPSGQTGYVDSRALNMF